MKVDASIEGNELLNQQFQSKELVGQAFYKQLKNAGFAYQFCVLVSWYMTGASEFFGKIIRQDGEIFEFDVDLDYPQYSTWANITTNFLTVYERSKRHKPWKDEVVAYGYFLEKSEERLSEKGK